MMIRIDGKCVSINQIIIIYSGNIIPMKCPLYVDDKYKLLILEGAILP